MPKYVLQCFCAFPADIDYVMVSLAPFYVVVCIVTIQQIDRIYMFLLPLILSHHDATNYLSLFHRTSLTF